MEFGGTELGVEGTIGPRVDAVEAQSLVENGPLARTL
jgi:hypothetical protein